MIASRAVAALALLWGCSDRHVPPAAADGGAEPPTCAAALSHRPAPLLTTAIGGDVRSAGEIDGHSCGPEAGGPDEIHEIVVTERARLIAHVSSRSPAPIVLALRGSCGAPESELACAHAEVEGDGARVDLVVDPGRYHLVVDTPGAALGYVGALTVAPISVACEAARPVTVGEEVSGLSAGALEPVVCRSAAGDTPATHQLTWLAAEIAPGQRVVASARAEPLGATLPVMVFPDCGPPPECVKSGSEPSFRNAGTAPVLARFAVIAERGTFQFSLAPAP